MKKYKAHQEKVQRPDRAALNKTLLTKAELLDIENNEGAYQFLPEWNDSQPAVFGQLNSDITF